MDLGKKQKQVLYGGIEAGLNDGAAVVVHGPYGSIAGFGAASSTRADHDQTSLWMLNAYCQQFYAMYWAMLAKPDMVKSVHLTDREREVMTWCASGKSNWEIGSILSISHNSVDFHLRNVFRKLGAHNRIAATVKALYYGLISL